MKYNLVSIDLAKNSFQLCGFSSSHHVAVNKKFTRKKLLEYLAAIEPTTVVMEACYSANPWGRKIESLGHSVKLIPPYQAKPFLVGNKNDHNDAIAIGEAAMRPTARFVPVKTLAQQDVQSLQRIRERLLRTRTAVANQCRGLLSEYFIVVDKKITTLQQAIPDILEDAANGLTPVARGFIRLLSEEIHELTQKMATIEKETLALVEQNADYQRLLEMPGIGPVTAFMASVNVNQFKHGRQMAAWIGLAPRQYASGDVNRLGAISKRGNESLRRLLIHGARAVTRWSEGKTDKFNQWINQLKQRMHPNKVIVAVANKLARIAWAILSKQIEYSAQALTR